MTNTMTPALSSAIDSLAAVLDTLPTDASPADTYYAYRDLARLLELCSDVSRLAGARLLEHGRRAEIFTDTSTAAEPVDVDSSLAAARRHAADGRARADAAAVAFREAGNALLWLASRSRVE